MIDKARPGVDKGGSNSSVEGIRDWKSWMKILFLFWGCKSKTHAGFPGDLCHNVLKLSEAKCFISQISCQITIINPIEPIGYKYGFALEKGY